MAVGEQANNRASRYQRVGVAKSSTPKASWEDADPQDLWRTVQAVVAAGDAITFSRTRDGGAVVITILSGDDRVKEYATGAEEIASLLADVRASAEDAM